MWQNVAFILIGLGVLALIGWAAQGFFTASEIPLIIRVAAGVVAIAVVALLGIAIKQRIAQAKKEDFKEVEK